MDRTQTALLAAVWLTLALAVALQLLERDDFGLLLVVVQAWLGGLVSHSLFRRYRRPAGH